MQLEKFLKYFIFSYRNMPLLYSRLLQIPFNQKLANKQEKCPSFLAIKKKAN